MATPRRPRTPPSVTQPEQAPTPERFAGTPLAEPPAAPSRRTFRPNILLLFAMGYLTVLAYLGALIYLGQSAAAAFESAKELIMILVTASVTMANSVLKADEDN